MNMIMDSPDSIMLQYENMAYLVESAETQKDIITQALRDIFPQGISIIEFTPSSDFFATKTPSPVPSKLENKFYKVKCLECQSREIGEYMKGSAYFAAEKTETEATIHFSSRSEKNVIFKWKVELTQKIPRYFITPLETIEQNHVINSKRLTIINCEDLKICTPSNSFASENEAKSAEEQFSDQIAITTLSPGKPLSANLVKNKDLILAGEKVRIILTSNSGLHIETYGRALKAGIKNAVIPVELENKEEGTGFEKKRVIDATVNGIGEVSYAR